MSIENATSRVTVGMVEVVDASGHTLVVLDGPNRAVLIPSGTAFEAAGLNISTTELGYLDVTPGTSTASKAVVLSSVKAVDTLRATTELSLGGTGVPGEATVQTSVTKAVSAFADTVAKAVFTVTVPNAAHNALITIDALGILGAGGAIGAGEASRSVTYQVAISRTAGVAVVPSLSSAIGGASALVAGGDAITSVVATLSGITGAVGATNTFQVLFAITRSGAGATNHTGVFSARVLNANASGITIA